MKARALALPLHAFSRTGGPKRPKDEDPDPKRWERRFAFFTGWMIGLILLKLFGFEGI